MLGDRIAELRKQNGMSQEELAEKLKISRQSVSKWESGQSLPEIDKIIILSELFHVSTDYLLKEETMPAAVSQEPAEETADREEMEDERFQDWNRTINETYFRQEEISQYILRADEAEQFLNAREAKASITARAVSECILCPVPIILLASYADWRGILNADLIGGIGSALMFVMIAHAVYLFLKVPDITKQCRFLNETVVLPDYEAEALIEAKEAEMKERSASEIRIGVVLCILAIIPVIILGAMFNNEFAGGIGVSLMFCMAACAVTLFIRAFHRNTTFRRLHRNEVFKAEPAERKSVKKVYWHMVTVVYLLYSFLSGNWHISWIIWIIASAVYPLITGVTKEPDSEE